MLNFGKKERSLFNNINFNIAKTAKKGNKEGEFKQSRNGKYLRKFRKAMEKTNANRI